MFPCSLVKTRQFKPLNPIEIGEAPSRATHTLYIE